MPNNTNVDQKFENFIASIGLRKEFAAELWRANIQSPQELAGYASEDLSKISSNPLLLNHIHPILQKHVYKITIAKDPYKKAISIMRKHAEDSDDEPMDTGLTADSTSFVDTTGVSQGHTSGPGNGRSNGAGVRFNNDRLNMRVNDNSNVQSRIGFTTGKPNNGSNTIMISGGNFVQSNVMGQGPVTYNNTNTTISTSLDQNGGKDEKVSASERRSRLLNSTLWIDGARRRTADLRWNDQIDFWVDRIAVPTADLEEYSRHFVEKDVYDVRNRGNSRALILNNIEFDPSSRMSRRQGAQVDCERIETLVANLGFGDVQRYNDKTADEMKEILEQFAKSPRNMSADMILLYIGSHGERDKDGNDSFVGKDGRRLTFNFVKDLFSPNKCPALFGKPKIFFLQFCRQDTNNAPRPEPPPRVLAPVQESAVDSDCGAFVTAPATAPAAAAPVEVENETRDMDMVCVFATLAGTKAYRDTSDGSWFVTAIIRIFTEHAGKDDVLSMLTKVNNCVSLNEGQEGRARAVQVSEVVHTLRKKIKFFPGKNQ